MALRGAQILRGRTLLLKLNMALEGKQLLVNQASLWKTLGLLARTTAVDLDLRLLSSREVMLMAMRVALRGSQILRGRTLLLKVNMTLEGKQLPVTQASLWRTLGLLARTTAVDLDLRLLSSRKVMLMAMRVALRGAQILRGRTLLLKVNMTLGKRLPVTQATFWRTLGLLARTTAMDLGLRLLSSRGDAEGTEGVTEGWADLERQDLAPRSAHDPGRETASCQGSVHQGMCGCAHASMCVDGHIRLHCLCIPLRLKSPAVP